jgi:hypothetical protein
LGGPLRLAGGVLDVQAAGDGLAVALSVIVMSMAPAQLAGCTNPRCQRARRLVAARR